MSRYLFAIVTTFVGMLLLYSGGYGGWNNQISRILIGTSGFLFILMAFVVAFYGKRT